MNFSAFSDAAVAGPFLVLLASVVFIVLAIARFQLPPFFALLFAAVFVGVAGRWLQPGEETLVALLDRVMREFGNAAGAIGYPIAAAVVIGAALMESGAADRIVRSAVAAVGERRAPLAMMGCSFILGVPVFFDTVFFLMVPLARALSLRTGKNYVLFLLAIVAGGAVTHATVPPTPGPLITAEMLGVDLGVALLIGLALSAPPALGALAVAAWIDRRYPIPVRPVQGAELEAERMRGERPEHDLPGLLVSVLPLVIPVVLIAGGTVAGLSAGHLPASWSATIAVLGNKNVALTLAAIAAVAVYLRQQRRRWSEAEPVIGGPLGTAGVIILITAAGGAYGAMIRTGGIREAVGAVFAGSAINYIFLAWLLAAVVRVAQGSATVAMITAAGIVGSLAPPEGFDFHRVYLVLAIGFGASILSWMNDSGFWIFSRMSGLTQRETLRSWTVVLTAISLFGLIELLLVAAFLPLKG